MKRLLASIILFLSVFGVSFASDSYVQINAACMVDDLDDLFDENVKSYTGVTINLRSMMSSAFGVNFGMGVYVLPQKKSDFKCLLDLYTGFSIAPFNNGFLAFFISPIIGVSYDMDNYKSKYSDDDLYTIILGVNFESTIRISKSASLDLGLMCKPNINYLIYDNCLEDKWSFVPNVGISFDF